MKPRVMNSSANSGLLAPPSTRLAAATSPVTARLHPVEEQAAAAVPDHLRDGQDEQQRCDQDGGAGQGQEDGGAHGGARGHERVRDDSEGGDLGEADPQAHVAHPVGGAVVVGGQLPVQGGAEHGTATPRPATVSRAAVRDRPVVHGPVIDVE